MAAGPFGNASASSYPTQPDLISTAVSGQERSTSPNAVFEGHAVGAAGTLLRVPGIGRQWRYEIPPGTKTAIPVENHGPFGKIVFLIIQNGPWLIPRVWSDRCGVYPQFAVHRIGYGNRSSEHGPSSVASSWRRELTPSFW